MSKSQETIKNLALDGIGQKGVEASIGRGLSPDELIFFRKYRAKWTASEAKRKRDKAEHRQSEAARQRALLARENELVIPPCKNPKRRAACEKNLVKWLETYCMEDGGFLERKPSKGMYPIIEAMQTALTSSGWFHIRMPRGFGKTSFMKGGIACALAVGFRKYVVLVAAADGNSTEMLRDIYALFEQGETFAEDYPEIAVPFRALAGKTQRAKSLTIGGKPCNIKINAKELRLPIAAGYPSSGAIVDAIGFRGNARGKVRGKLRPDLVIFDDLQDEEIAKNEELVAQAINTVEKNFLNLGGHTKSISALMTSTPIEPDDLSEQFAKKDTWFTQTFKMVESFPVNLSTYWEEYNSIRRHEVIQGRNPAPELNKFYRAHRKEMDKGCVVLNPDNYDHKLEVSGIQHAMNLYFKGETQFMSEYQMQPKRSQTVFELTPQVVVSRTRADWKPWHIPPESIMTVCATDLNPAYGFSSTAITFDRLSTGTVFWYGIHPTKMHKEKMTEAEYKAGVYNQLVVLGKNLAADCATMGVTLDAWAIDAGGDQFEPVMRFWRNAKSLGIPFEIVPMLGRAGRSWNPFVRSRIRNAINETVECGDRDRDGNKQRWTAFNADYWRETMQRAWLGEIGTSGGLSLFGDKGIRHDEFALQVTAEKLKRKEKGSDGRDKYEWQGGETHRHDYGDAATMCLALAGNKGLTQGVEFVGVRKKSTKVIIV